MMLSWDLEQGGTWKNPCRRTLGVSENLGETAVSSMNHHWAFQNAHELGVFPIFRLTKCPFTDCGDLKYTSPNPKPMFLMSRIIKVSQLLIYQAPALLRKNALEQDWQTCAECIEHLHIFAKASPDTVNNTPDGKRN